MAVGSPIIRMPRRSSRWFVGEFAVAAGAITAGTVKYKNEVGVTFISTGLYQFQCLENGVAARPGAPCRLAAVIANVTLPGATAGGWSHFINVDNMNASGNFRYQFNQQSFAAADTTGTVKLAFLVELENA